MSKTEYPSSFIYLAKELYTCLKTFRRNLVEDNDDLPHFSIECQSKVEVM
ncbi:hypothetical protein BHE74_00056414 [Ensete ventricosum]|nr:hypothetical protein GW17_00020082 [Ensete ventricosum]RWW38358.1 hypothetical protein BHE74_00056414 [Ensete ventricosum]RZR81160.1 hypothetical protein BHM03_00007342 [Ensete ventricosum]